MEILKLDVQQRDKTKKMRALRRENVIPCEYYGKGVDNQSFQVDYQSFRKVFREAGMNTIIALSLGGKQEINVLVHRIQQDPVSDEYIHIDFINVRMGEELNTKIPLTFVGIAPAVKEFAGIFTSNLTEVEVKCLPKDLVHDIEVNVETLIDFNSYIRVKDLILPPGITVLNEEEDVVATVSAPKEEVEEEPEVAEGEEGEGEEGEVAEGEGAEKDEKAEGGEKKEEKAGGGE